VAAERVVLWEPDRERGLTVARFEGQLVRREDGTALEGRFLPSPTVPRFLRGASLLLAGLVIASLGVVLASSESTPMRFLLPMTSTLLVLGFPLLVLALASHRHAAEARLAKAIRERLE
jgi:hypothetical protein